MFQTYWVGRLVISLVMLGGLSLFSHGLSSGLSANDEPNNTNAEILTRSVKTNSAESPRANPSTVVEEIPEEVLRTEIYTEARSPVDGKSLSAAEYIELDQSLQEKISDIPPRLLVSEKLQRLIDLLKLRKLIRQVIPFF